MSIENPRVAILASGDRESGAGGSTAERVIRDVLEEKVAFGVGLVICNNPIEKVPGLYARIEAVNDDFVLRGDNRVEVVNISSATHPDGPQERGQTLAESEAISQLLEDREIDLVSMLGYMKKLNGEFVETWGWKQEYSVKDHQFGVGAYHSDARILNNHPSILPHTADTHGLGAHQRAIELYRDGTIRHSAMTWHLASAEIDTGPIIDYEPVEINPEDDAESLGERVQAVEKSLTSLVIESHLVFRGRHLSVNS
jgi:phosphoribosylglycinamide formyltransferase-1